MRWLPAFALALVATAARADTYHAVVDRVDLEPAALGGYRLRVYLSAFQTGGQAIELEPQEIKTSVGGGALGQPFALGTYGASGGETLIVVAIQGTVDFAPAVPAIVDAIDRDVVAPLGERAQVAVMTYGDATSAAKFAPAKAARAKLAQLQPDLSAGDPGLLDALDRALVMIRNERAASPHPLRAMIVVFGDGRDRANDRERVTRLGERAAKAGVRIHTFAFSAADQRRPMLALGELSKRSLGTFRWVRNSTADSWDAAANQLHDEIDRQYVVTYFVTDGDDVAGKKLRVDTVGRTATKSNELKIPEEATCAGQACEPGAYCADACTVALPPSHRGVLGWIVLVGAIALGGIVALGVIGFVITKLGQRAPKPPPVVVAMPGAPIAQATSGPGPALLVASGPFAGQRLPLRHGFTIGKLPHCTLVLDDAATSGQHALVGMDAAGKCTLYDLGSTNGTFVDGAAIREHPLVHGATIKIGSTELRFLAQ